MNRRKAVMIALGALVAGAAALVYAQNDGGNSPRGAAGGTAMAAGESKGQAPEASYDFNALPEPVRRMLEEILAKEEEHADDLASLLEGMNR